MQNAFKVGGALVVAAGLATDLFAPHAIAASSEADDSASAASSLGHSPVPRVILISLDGAKPQFIEKFIATHVLPSDSGLGLLRRRGARALQNITETPSLTAVSHLAIATGSTAVHNDVPSNTFHAVASPITTLISGFAAPIGGYQISPLGPTANPTARPLWLALREKGFKVVTATWPGVVRRRLCRRGRSTTRSPLARSAGSVRKVSCWRR
jgi:predicted AlkP superfamily pyrophosphatase or phosphodiesterase